MNLLAAFRRSRRRSQYLVRQYDRMDCGPAALHSVLRFWGGDAPFSTIRDAAGTDLSGTPFVGLLRAARRLGFEARGAVGTYEALMREDRPCIAHMVLEDGTHHYLVCEAAYAEEVWAGDPMEGRRRIPRATFERLWKTRALLLLQPTGSLRQDQTPTWIRWFSHYLLQDPVWFMQSLFLGGVGALFGILTALFIQELVDRLIPSGDVKAIVAAAVVLLFILLIRTGTEHLRQRFLIRLNRIVSSRLNRDFVHHILRLPLRFFETRTTGDITARLSDGMRIQQAVVDGAATALIDGTVVVGSLAFLLLTEPRLGFLGLAALPLYAAATTGVSRALQRDHGLAMAAFAKVEGFYLDSLGSIEAITGFAVADTFAATHEVHFGVFQERVEALQIRSARLNLLVDLFGSGIALLTLFGGALLVVHGDLLIGGLIAGYTLLIGTLPAVARIIRGIVALQEATIAANRLRDLMLTPRENWSGGGALGPIEKLELREGSVEWADGSCPFAEVSLQLNRGEMVGLIGDNGAGKSTILRILSRSIELSTGSLLVNGHAADTVSLTEYRRRVLLLPNDVRLVSGTLADNVIFGRTIPGPEVLEAIVADLGLDRFMERFRNRWASRIGEGGRRVSAGERQMIGLMRALVIPPDLLLVDEGIGSTDEGNTALVLDVLRAFSRTGMVLIVSHDPRVHTSVNRLYRLVSGKLDHARPPALRYSPLMHPPHLHTHASTRSCHVLP